MEYCVRHRGEPADMDAFIKYAYPMTEAPTPMEQPEFTTLWLSLLQPSRVDTPRTEDYKHGARMVLELMTKETKSFGMTLGKSEASLIAEGAASVGSGSGVNVGMPPGVEAPPLGLGLTPLPHTIPTTTMTTNDDDDY
jgi:hypothetical protein